MSDKKSASISITDIGPVTEFELKMDQPGLWCLRGKQGAGKTTILRTCQLAVDGRVDVKPTKRDGAPRGEATIAGRTVRIARQIREEGDLTVDGLGDLDISSLHQPKFMDAATRDRHRIKVLVRLAGVEADASLFHEVLGGKAKFESIVDADALKTDDLVEMAARAKRAIEKAAQLEETKADTALSGMRAQAAIYEGVDLATPNDEAALQKKLTAALEHRSALTQKRASAIAIQQKAAAAGKQLEQASSDAPSLEAAMRDGEAAGERVEAAQKTIDDLERKLATARRFLSTANAELDAANAAIQSAQRFQNLTASWRADIQAAANIECPTADDLSAAHDHVTKATDAATLGNKVRAAIAASEAAKDYAEQAKFHRTASLRLRDAARDTQDALTAAISRIPNCPLKVKVNDDGDARLVVATDRSDAEAFDELSDGERWRYVVALAAQKNRLIVLPQAAFGELSESSRAALHALAVDHDCFLLTAQADDGDLRGEMYASETAEAAA